MKKIALSGKKGFGKFALVDDEEFERMSKFRWHLIHLYVARIEHIGYDNKKRILKTVYMHRLIANTPDGMDTDHINHNALDNRKENLRICTTRENTCNSRQKTGVSGFRGVSKDKKKWKAQIYISGAYMYLGSYKTTIEAARVWNEAAKKYHGEFAILNKIM